MRPGPAVVGALVAVVGLAFGAAAAPAHPPPQGISPWNGSNPFECEVQDVGLGTDFPDPGADPFCVQFDKTRQNITELGLLDFVLKEPARVAAAVNKCRYYQRDSWRGWIIQDDPATALYGFDGRYYFDKSTGSGGVYIENFSLLGQSFDPTTLPGFPEQLRPYVTHTGGGAQVSMGVDIPYVPGCEDDGAEGSSG